MRRAAKIVGWVLLALVLLAILCAGALVGIGNTDMGRRAIERLTAQVTHGMVQLQGLAGRFPDRLRVATVNLEDAQGTWLSARTVAVDWSPWRLASGEITVHSLTAGQVRWLRSPRYRGSAAPPS